MSGLQPNSVGMINKSNPHGQRVEGIIRGGCKKVNVRCPKRIDQQKGMSLYK